MLRADAHVSTVELFFDLVYVFAVTQLSHLLAEHASADRVIQVAVLLAMVWQVWVYTTWALTYLDPDRGPVRVLLLTLMLGSLVLAAGLTEAFAGRGLLVAIMYVAMQLGRCLFVIVALRGEALQRAFLRILPWTAMSSVVVIVGGLEHGHVRELLWAAAVALDLVGAALGFYVPGLGRSDTHEWTVSGAHFAERCQAFVLIALGESIVVSGATLAGLHRPGAAEITAFVVSFAASAGLWWIYFSRAAEDSALVIASSGDPGRLARNAFHWIHPLIIGGIILGAAADDLVLADPSARGDVAVAWLVLGGTALYLGAHALFKAVIWRLASWPRLVGTVSCLALLGLAPHASRLVLACCALAVIVAVAVADRLTHPQVSQAG